MNAIASKMIAETLCVRRIGALVALPACCFPHKPIFFGE